MTIDEIAPRLAAELADFLSERPMLALGLCSMNEVQLLKVIVQTQHILMARSTRINQMRIHFDDE